ncbi:MAG: hypothetical protein WC319_15065 [Candidatus Paceibacterota bacterium]|jgi:hypothetical protein
MNKQLKDELRNLHKKNDFLANRLLDIDRLSQEYSMSVFQKIRIKRIVIRTYKQAIEFGYLEKIREEEERKKITKEEYLKQVDNSKINISPKHTSYDLNEAKGFNHEK